MTSQPTLADIQGLRETLALAIARDDYSDELGDFGPTETLSDLPEDAREHYLALADAALAVAPLAEQGLEAGKAEPVEYRYRYLLQDNPSDQDWHHVAAKGWDAHVAHYRLNGYEVQPLYDHPPAETIADLKAERDRLREALKPFAAIVPSSFFPADGSEGDKYEVVLGDGRPGEFTGLDLARARSALAGKPETPNPEGGAV